jgi:hypothetical protein
VSSVKLAAQRREARAAQVQQRADEVLAVCRRLVAEGVYPSIYQLRKQMPGRGGNYLLRVRNAHVASGALPIELELASPVHRPRKRPARKKKRVNRRQARHSPGTDATQDRDAEIKRTLAASKTEVRVAHLVERGLEPEADVGDFAGDVCRDEPR